MIGSVIAVIATAIAWVVSTASDIIDWLGRPASNFIVIFFALAILSDCHTIRGQLRRLMEFTANAWDRMHGLD